MANYVFEMYSNMDIDSMSRVQFIMNLDLSCKKSGSRLRKPARIPAKKAYPSLYYSGFTGDLRIYRFGSTGTNPYLA